MNGGGRGGGRWVEATTPEGGNAGEAWTGDRSRGMKKSAASRGVRAGAGGGVGGPPTSAEAGEGEYFMHEPFIHEFSGITNKK